MAYLLITHRSRLEAQSFVDEPLRKERVTRSQRELDEVGITLAIRPHYSCIIESADANSLCTQKTHPLPQLLHV